jgi:pimeloyl-ACP methyl ester carboxylesterase
MPGTEKSDRVERFPADFWWYNAELCVALVRSLGIDEFIAIGTSGGGIIALNVAIIAGKSVKCLVADSIPGECPTHAEIQKWIKANELKSEDQINFWRQAHGEDWENIIKLDSALMLEAINKSLYKGSLGKVISPVLLTASLADDCIADIGMKMCDIARKVQTAKTVFFSTGGHPLMWSKPDEFRSEVMWFISDNSIWIQRK